MRLLTFASSLLSINDLGRILFSEMIADHLYPFLLDCSEDSEQATCLERMNIVYLGKGPHSQAILVHRLLC